MKYVLFVSLFVFSHFVRAEVSYQYTNSYYDFSADNIKGLIKAVKNQGPKVGIKNAWAIVKWDLNTEYSFKTSEEGCKIVVESMDLLANVTLPKWTNIQNQTNTLQSWWAEYLKFITEHEGFHFDNALISAKEFETTLLDMPVEENCTKVKSKYLALKHRLLITVQVKDRQIDSSSKKRFYSNEKLFSPLNRQTSVVFESGGMSSYIAL